MFSTAEGFGLSTFSISESDIKKKIEQRVSESNIPTEITLISVDFAMKTVSN